MKLMMILKQLKEPKPQAKVNQFFSLISSAEEESKMIEDSYDEVDSQDGSKNSAIEKVNKEQIQIAKEAFQQINA